MSGTANKRSSNTERVSRIENAFLERRGLQQTGLIPYINAGDPNLDTTAELIAFFERRGACAVELGVPFPNSFTDGDVIRRSHKRALERRTSLKNILEMVLAVRRHCAIPLFLMAEYRYTVMPLGFDGFLARCTDAGIDGVLMHCLPPLLTHEYLDLARYYEIDAILSLFPNTPEFKREFVLQNAAGFIYLASYFGKTGSENGFGRRTFDFFRSIRERTEKPLAAGFGVKSQRELSIIHAAGVDAGIIGSPVMEIVENHLNDSTSLMKSMARYWRQMENQPENNELEVF